MGSQMSQQDHGERAGQAGAHLPPISQKVAPAMESIFSPTGV